MNIVPKQEIKVNNQAELDAALAAGTYPIIVGDEYFEVRDSATVTASGSATVTAWGSATVTAWGSATVRASDSATVTASDSATVRAWGSATVTASGSATVTASDSATVRASDSATVTASKCVAIHKHSKDTNITGGVVIDVADVEASAENWCEYYGIDVVDGIAILFKGVDRNFISGYGTSYAPGTVPSAPDWSPRKVCGQELHFSPRPQMTLSYAPDAQKFLACPIRVSEIVILSLDKCKAPGLAAPCWEVDLDGDAIPVVAPADAKDGE